MKAPSEGVPGISQELLDDCDRPACDDTVAALQTMMNRVQAKEKKGTGLEDSKNKSRTKTDCPPTSPELGRASWTLLHSMAAWYPDEPTNQDEKHVTNFMAALARFYPCTWCATDFRANLEQSPVRTSTRTELCTWICEQHNLVNRKLGKPEYPCDIKALDERWRKSTDPKCQSKNH